MERISRFGRPRGVVQTTTALDGWVCGTPALAQGGPLPGRRRRNWSALGWAWQGKRWADLCVGLRRGASLLAEKRAPKGRSSLMPGDTGLGGRFTQLQLVQGLVDQLDRLAQFPAGGGQGQPAVLKGRVAYDPVDIQLSEPLRHQRRRQPRQVGQGHGGVGPAPPAARAQYHRRCV